MRSTVTWPPTKSAITCSTGVWNRESCPIAWKTALGSWPTAPSRSGCSPALLRRIRLSARAIGEASGLAFELPLFKKEEFARELRVVERLKALAGRYEKSVAQMAIAWTLGHPAVSVGLVGVRNEWELKENVAAVGWKLDAGDPGRDRRDLRRGRRAHSR